MNISRLESKLETLSDEQILDLIIEWRELKSTMMPGGLYFFMMEERIAEAKHFMAERWKRGGIEYGVPRVGRKGS